HRRCNAGRTQPERPLNLHPSPNKNAPQGGVVVVKQARSTGRRSSNRARDCSRSRCIRERSAFAKAQARTPCGRTSQNACVLVEPEASQPSPFAKQKRPTRGRCCLAESEGFEPSMQFLTAYSLSRGAPSTT